ncbi:MAG: hypothetical protein RLP14_05980 [Owenweeksia sp.]
MKKWYFLLTICLGLSGCSKNEENCQINPKLKSGDLLGTWYERERTEETGFGGTVYFGFTLQPDSFFMKRYTYTDAASSFPPCDKFYWNDYMMGEYYISNNRMYLNGLFTDSTFSEPIDSFQCPTHKIGGKYKLEMVISKKCEKEWVFRTVGKEGGFGEPIQMITMD